MDRKIRFILASGSLWRKRLLIRNGIKCAVHISNFEEKSILGETKNFSLFFAKTL